MAIESRPWLLRYGSAPASIALATLIRGGLDPILGGRFAYMTYFVALAYTAWYGGLRPAILALALSWLAADYFVLEPRGSLLIHGIDQQVGFVLFILVGLAITCLGGAMRAAQRDVERALEAERAQRERLRVTLQSIGDGILLVSRDGLVSALNPVAEQLTGWGSDEAVGRPFKAVLHTIDDVTLRTDEAPFEQVLREGRVIRQTDFTTLISKEGASRPIVYSTAPIIEAGRGIDGVVISFRDITERKRAEEALRESEERFARFMQRLPGLAWIKDVEGRYIYTNDAAEKAFRTPRSQLYGKTDDEVFPPEIAAQFRENDRRALASEAGVRVIETLEHEDGVLHHSLVSKFPITGPDGKAALVGGMAIDITDRVEMEGALKEADRRKDEFLATLAHELRNPLAPIRNALHLMRRPDGDMSGIEAERAMAERQVVHLARLIDDLMDIARISRGKIELRREVVELAPVVGRAIESVRSSLGDRRHELSVSLPAEPVFLEADPTRLEQVFWNLLNNAIKYTEPGGSIGIVVEREGGEVAVRVRDTGIGIEPESLPRIFEMFVQVGDSSARSVGGLGIGLSLVRTLVEMHGGKVLVCSEGRGKGTEFVVRLPALPEAPQGRVEPKRGDRPHPDATPPRRRILVVDDNVDAARSMARLLTRAYGQEVRVAHDGPGALEAAGEFHPEVILLDIGMPGMDGYEVARRLRHRPEPERTLLVALTGWGQESDRQRSRDAGFDLHLIKPVDPDDLRRLLARVGAKDMSRNVISPRADTP